MAILILLGISLGSGWIAGGPRSGDRIAISLTTSLRNVGLGLVITASAFAGTKATTAVVFYGFVQLFGSLLVALWWRNTSRAAVHPG